MAKQRKGRSGITWPWVDLAAIAVVILAARYFVPEYAHWTEYRTAPMTGEECLRDLDPVCVKAELNERYGPTGSLRWKQSDMSWIWALRFIESDVDYRAQLETIFEADKKSFRNGLEDWKLLDIANVGWFLADSGRPDASKAFVETLINMQRERGGNVPAGLASYQPWTNQTSDQSCQQIAERWFERSGSLVQASRSNEMLSPCYLEYFRQWNDVDFEEAVARTLEEMRQLKNMYGEEPHKYGYGEGMPFYQRIDRIASMAAIAAYRERSGWGGAFN
ncbi:hypothetical protein [Henriciella litoralis]|uniref:hypothetical protein n=1 Tax=Henriciella litoralis TaxID=568102 RepID=UPI00111BE24D|nr:hypothetical protein [Henriciella litoralis]